MPTALAPIVGPRVPIFCRKTADEAKSAIAFADSTNMGLAVAANKAYAFRFVVFFTTNAATVGIRLGLNGPAGATLRFGIYVPASAPSGVGSALVHAAAAAYDTEAVAVTAGPGLVATMAVVEGVLVTGATPGTLQLRHGSETATATTILANSYGQLTEIG
jgi:hypothetical protein